MYHYLLLYITELKVYCVLDLYLGVFALRLALFLHDEQEGRDDNADYDKHEQSYDDYATLSVIDLIITHLISYYTLRFLACKAETVSSVRARA